MSPILTQHLPALERMKKYPSKLFYKGNLELLQRPKISIVGTRRPSNYTRQCTYMLAKAVIYNNKWNSTIINGTIGDANAI
jgi:DNA processing protein